MDASQDANMLINERVRGTNSDPATAEEPAFGAVVPLHVGIALEPAPQHGYAIPLARPIEQQRCEPLHLDAGLRHLLELGVQPRLEALRIGATAERAGADGDQVRLQFGQVGADRDELVDAWTQQRERGPGLSKSDVA